MMRIFIIFLVSILGQAAWAAEPLERFSASMRQLYAQHQAKYGRTLDEYAVKQGFREPVERIGTVLHEMVHVASYIHQGFFIEGVFYEPYLSNWPDLTNQGIAPLIPPADRDLIYTSYVLKAPGNGLGSVLDELNAYGHVAPTICVYEPISAAKQVMNLIGFLRLQEAYLQILRTTRLQDYARMLKSQAHIGAIRLITKRAWSALKVCGKPESEIPMREVLLLF